MLWRRASATSARSSDGSGRRDRRAPAECATRRTACADSQRDAPGFREAMTQLRGAQKSARGGPPYSIFVNRPMGRVLAALAFRAGLTPNQVTALSAVATFVGVGLLAAAPASYVTGVAVGLLLVLGYALDSADGQLARLRGGGSLQGEWLDHTVDSLKVVVVHLAVLVTWYLHLDLRDRVAAGAARLRRGVERALLRHDPGRPAGSGHAGRARRWRRRPRPPRVRPRRCSSCPPTTASSAWPSCCWARTPSSSASTRCWPRRRSATRCSWSPSGGAT